MWRPKVVWVDLTVHGPSQALADTFQHLVQVRSTGALSGPPSVSSCGLPDAIFIEYDYPDIASLKLLQQTRQQYPTLPLVMFTEQHSESLAVWAFRSGVWDFLVKPLSLLDAESLIASLSRHAGARCPQSAYHDRGFLIPIPDEVKFRGQSLDEQSIQPAVNFVASHYRDKILEKEMAQLCHMGTFRFSRTFRKVKQVTFQEYLIRYRLKESCRMLLNPNATIADVAFSVGFNDASYFTRVFRKYLEFSPTQYRELGDQARAVSGLDKAVDAVELLDNQTQPLVQRNRC